MKKNYGKILIIILPILAAILLLYPTYRANELTNKQNMAFERAKKAKNPTDSLAIIEQFDKAYGDALKGAKINRLKLGLDLRGGMYVTLEVDVVKLLEESAQQDAIDDVFNSVIDKTTKEAAMSDEDVISIFKRNFNQIARPKRKFLSDYFDFGGKTEAAESDENIISKLQDNEKEAIDQALEVIRQRIDKYGIAEPTIQKQGSRRIMLELPGVTNEVEMRQLLQTTARLEFKLVRSDENLVSAFYQIDKMLAREATSGEKNPLDTLGLKKDTTKQQEQASVDTNAKKEKEAENNQDTTLTDSAKAAKAKADTSDPYAGLSDKEKFRRYRHDHPFTSLFDSYYIPQTKGARAQQIGYPTNNFPKGDYSFDIQEDSIRKFDLYLSRPDVKALMPFGVQILLAAKPQTMKDRSGKEYKFYAFYGLKREPELTGDVITNAVATYDPTTNEPVVSMTMNDDGSEKWATITGANLKKRISIVLDNQVYSAPVVQSKIVGGNSQITGMANAEEAKLLKIVLKAGALKAPVKIIEERVVGPSLGEDSIRSGLSASAFALMLVVLFMIIYYTMAGFIAVFALIIDLSIIVSILAAFQGTLSLPGIAGVILTIGMAVDANILIYERIREELYKGRSQKSAVEEGYRKAFRAILDTNTTSFFTGLILYFFGTGPIKGFAMTLMMGILATLFTQIVVSRAVIELIMSGGRIVNYGQPKEEILEKGR